MKDNLNSSNEDDLECVIFGTNRSSESFKRFASVQRLVIGLNNDGMSRISPVEVIEAGRLMRNDGGRERDTKACMRRGRKAGRQEKMHGVKDGWSETQLREVARKAAEDEE